MRHLLALPLLALVLVLASSPVRAADCQFVLGFKTLRDLIGHNIVGECLENEHLTPNGDAVQRTTGGLLVWRKADNWTAFTDGARTWINGPYGLQQRLNWQRFPWEPDYAPGGVAVASTPTPAPISLQPTATPLPLPTPAPAQPTIDPLLAHVYHIMRTTEEGNRIADIFARLQASATFEEMGNSSSWWSSPPPEVAVNEKYRHEDPRTLGLRLIWPTMWLMAYEEDGGIETFERCMTLESAIQTREIWYWSQLYGWKGKRNPAPRMETWANEWVEMYVELGSDPIELFKWVWVINGFREKCERYGEPDQHIDPDLLSVFRMAMTGGDDGIGSQTLYVLIGTGVDVVFGPLPKNVYGRFSGSRNLITINESLRGEDDDTLASILVHEIYHAQEHQARKGRQRETAAACLQEEVDAFRLKGKWWYERFGRYGKRSRTAAERWSNTVMKTWRKGGNALVELVLLSKGYQEQCLGGTVN